MRRRALLLVLSLGIAFCAAVSAQQPAANQAQSRLEAALAQSKGNRAELEQALAAAPKDQRGGIVFLISNMPAKDLTTLKADFLLQNTDLAWQARAKTPWGKAIPEDLFLNHVLPYASVTETREPWRQEMMALCLPLVKDCKSATEAAQTLNSALYAKLKVRYSTQRNRPDQSPAESIKTGLASCTGLSILLIDACRSVGIPARLVGIPKWVNKPGNHTWVEIWDGDWHFTGACEPDPKGLDRGWFVGDASLAKKDSVEHSIYASSFKRTDTKFPLVWAPGEKEVFAENVTDRYAKASKSPAPVTRLQVRVWGPGRKQRLATPVHVVDEAEPAKVMRGESRGESADTNDILSFEVPRKRRFVVRVGGDNPIERRVDTEDRDSLVVEVELGKPAKDKSPALSEDQRKKIFETAKSYFDAPPAERSGAQFDAKLDGLLRTNEEAVRQLAWQAYAVSTLHAEAKANFDQNLAATSNRKSAYTVKRVGKKPAAGWPLFIAMHGGGNAPKAVNDKQWAVMQNYYRNQDSVEGYTYVALRAPNDNWDGFYDNDMCPLLLQLIRQFVLFGDVDPNKVFLMGYSHGGYGAFFLGPKMPDRFAAVHASAAAPTDGTIAAASLRNLRFTFMIGENDTAYGRRERCEKFAAEIAALRKDNPGDYPVEMEFKLGNGHTGLPDRDKIKDMYAFQRNPVPRRLTWRPMDKRIEDFYWLSIDKPGPGQSIDVKIEGNKATVAAAKVERFTLWLDGRLVNLDEPLDLVVNGKASRCTLKPSFRTLCDSILRRGDINLAASCRVDGSGE